MRVDVPIAPAAALIGSVPIERRITGAGRPSLTAIAFSPDGRQLVFSGERGGVQQLFLRALDRPEATALPHTEGGDAPFFSPSGEWLGFWANGSLWRVRLDGSPAVEICKAPAHARAYWGDNDEIVFVGSGGLSRVPSAGGKGERLTTVDADAGETKHVQPFALPGSRSVIYTVNYGPGVTDWRVVAQSTDTGARHVLEEDATDARYVPSGATGFLVFMRRGTLLAASFNPKTLEVGAPLAITDGVMHALNTAQSVLETGAGQYTISANGHLAYLEGGVFQDRQNVLMWTDRAGKQIAVTTTRRPYGYINLAGDARQFVTSTLGLKPELLIGRLADGLLVPGPMQGRFINPMFSPNGRDLVFASASTGVHRNIYRMPVDGSSSPEALTSFAGGGSTPASWSQDGDELLFTYVPRGKPTEIWALSLNNRHRMRPVLQAGATHPRLSPDGRWLAYTVSVSSRPEVFVRSYPKPAGSIRISTNGGSSPLWTRRGAELVYVEHGEPDTVRMMAVEVSTSDGFMKANPKQLWELPEAQFAVTTPTTGFDVTPDGQRFLNTTRTIATPPAPKQITVVLNWFDELRQKMQNVR
jgi:WD40-like Beta Propeller Repeat